MSEIERLNYVENLERHIQRFVAMTGCSRKRAEQVLTAIDGPKIYKEHLRVHFAKGGTWSELEPKR